MRTKLELNWVEYRHYCLLQSCFKSNSFIIDKFCNIDYIELTRAVFDYCFQLITELNLFHNWLTLHSKLNWINTELTFQWAVFFVGTYKLNFWPYTLKDTWYSVIYWIWQHYRIRTNIELNWVETWLSSVELLYSRIWICLIFDEFFINDLITVYYSETAWKQSLLYKALYK